MASLESPVHVGFIVGFTVGFIVGFTVGSVGFKRYLVSIAMWALVASECLVPASCCAKLLF